MHRSNFSSRGTVSSSKDTGSPSSGKISPLRGMDALSRGIVPSSRDKISSSRGMVSSSRDHVLPSKGRATTPIRHQENIDPGEEEIDINEEFGAPQDPYFDDDSSRCSTLPSSSCTNPTLHTSHHSQMYHYSCSDGGYCSGETGYPSMMYHGYSSTMYPQAGFPCGLQKSSSWSYTPYQSAYYYSCGYFPNPEDCLDESEEVAEEASLSSPVPFEGSLDTDLSETLQPTPEAEAVALRGKQKYGEDSLKPDSDLPPVIRRRNRNRRRQLAQSMIDVGGPWDQSASRHRSQSVSEEQWTQLVQSKASTPQPVPSTPPIQEPPLIHRSRFNSGVATGGSRTPGNVPVRGVRGMTSSTSVCDLNALSQQQQQQQQQQVMPPSQPQHPHQLVPRMGGMHPSGSFQQLNLVPYSGGMIWAPAPCDMCHGPAPMYPPPHPSQGMKRAASNLSMNMSSASSDVSGYPWQPPHMHHHMPHPMYPGYYPPPPGPHMMQGSMQGSTISIPDSMAVFSKVSSSPAASVRSSSRRSHKSNKSRSFSQADISRRTRSSHRSDSDETTSTSPSADDDILNNSKPGYPGGILAWQCDHCTFINQAGSRVCGMCSKTQASTSYHKSSKRATERRRSEQRRFGGRRNDQEDDDREPSDFENDGKHNTHQTHTNGREHRRDRSSKLSTASRSNSKKKHRRRAGSSGSASDVVDELERQLSDIKVSKSRTTDFDGISSRYKERERERDRERGSRRREGLSGRIKSRNKNASERSRTPGRPSPDSQSAHSSPRAPSPADDEVFENEDPINEKKKESSHTNSHSNEGTLIGPGNSDETILATEQIAPPVEPNYFHKRSSAQNSRASTPPNPVVEIQHAEVKILPPIEAVEILPEPKQSDHLELPKRKEKSPSPFHMEVEEISFANTLDDVATMGTNEVADIDPSIDERPFSALPPIEEPKDETPCVQYVEPISSYEELMETALVSEHEDPAVEKANSSSIKVEKSNEEKGVEAVQDQQKSTVESGISGEEDRVNQEDEEIELRDHVEEDSFVNDDNRLDQEPKNREKMNEAIIEEAKETVVRSSPQNNVPRQSQQDARPQYQERSPSHGSIEDALGRPASSLESSPGFNRSLRDHQYTPLSFSSSDAAFYSPADSQDDSADERTRSRPAAPHQTLQTVVGAAADEELVTALESFKSTEERRSSRETIKSSVDDLPYSSEDPGEETSDVSLASPLDETLQHQDDEEASERRPTSPEGGYVSSDVYEGLTFQDALSGNADVRPLKKSASDQMLLKGPRRAAEEQSPKTMRRVVAGIDDRYLTVDEIVTKRQQEAMKRDGLELVQVLRDAEKAGYRAEEVSAALPVCGEKGPLAWLMDNWWHMVHTVMTLASTYGREKKENNFGQISEEEARAALRTHKGDIWAAVTESVEQRQNKFAELTARGNFPAALVAQALQRNAGDIEAAYAELLSLHPNSGADDREKAREDVSQVPASPQVRLEEDSHRQQEDDTSIYSNLVSTNANLLSKTEALMQEIEEEAPMLSKELKLKIVHAILDEEPGLEDDRPRMDSDEESTIEELLAREQNPTFYEYFTAVDLDDDGESRRAEEADNDAASNFYTDEAASEQYFETGTPSNTSPPGGPAPPSTPGNLAVPSDQQQGANASAGHTSEEMLYVRKEDVTVHPLKTYPKFANLSGAHFEDAAEKSPTPTASQKTPPPSSIAHTPPVKPSKSVSSPQPHVKPATGSESPASGVVLRQRKAPEDPKPETRSSVTYETSSSEEDESVSVTTGRLSLSLSHASDKDGGIDVTAATVEKERIQTDISPRVRSPGAAKAAGRPNFPSVRQTDIRHIAQLEEQESATSATSQELDEPHSSTAGGAATQTATSPASQQDSPVKQEPVKKASSIIGKAIAKAMARESSVRDGTPPVQSPEPEESSRGSTPASYTQESTVASSMLDSDVSTTPMSVTPRSTPDLQEEQMQGAGRGEMDSEDDDLLRSLDTIPEEEETSERTESGRVQSRSSARNFKLPFDPTSIVRLLTPTLLRGKDKAQKPAPSPEPPQKISAAVQKHDAPRSTTPSKAAAPADTSSSQQPDNPELGSESDNYQEARLSEKSDGSDSSTPHFADDNGEENSLSLIPPSSSEVIQDVDWTSSVTDDAKLGQTSKSSHHYYNESVQSPGNVYYNDSAIRAMPENDETIKVDPNDYESMYSIKRDLDSLRESSSQVSEKIESLGSRKKRHGPLKDSGSKDLPSTSKALSPKATKKQQITPDVEAGAEEHGQRSDEPPLSGAQLLAEQNTNTVKRSPKSVSKKSKDEIAKENSNKPDAASDDKMAEARSSKSQEKTYDSVSTKPKVAKTLKTMQKTKQAASGSDSNSTSEATSVKKSGASTLNKTAAKGASKESSTSDSNESSSSLTVKPKGSASSLIRKIESKNSESGSSGMPSTAVHDDHSIHIETTNDSPKAATEDDSAQEKPNEGPHHPNEDPPEARLQDDSSHARSEEESGDSEDDGAAVEGLEDLRGREPDHGEVMALKQQVEDIKTSLQSQMEDEKDGHADAAPQAAPETPTITVEESEDAGPAPQKTRTAEEQTEYEQLRFDRTVRRLLAEGQAGSYEKAELAAHLLTLSFDEEDSVAAAQECSSIYGALHFLQQECELCAEKLPMRKMVSMLHCTHRCCTDCAKTYFTYQIKTKNIREMRCPFCNEPNLDNTAEESTAEYFNHLDILLKGIVDEETHELFQRKLRDLTLMSDPSFRWCNKCSSGFIANPRARKLICPDCRDITCAHCRLPWEAQHEGISCDAFARWKQENDPEAQAQGVAKHLAEHGISCPKCRFQYSLAKGGCMHFTCSECKYEFCSGCGQPFRQGARCPVGPYCERLGLHAHHPRNCLFYLRDKEPPQLQQLLKEHNVPFDTEAPDEDGQAEDGGRRRQCQVPEQKETPDGLVDDICGRAVLQGNAGLCRLHYVEYLVEKINAHHLDPVVIFDEADLRVCLRRNGKSVPVRRWESEKLYRDKLIKLIKEQLPL